MVPKNKTSILKKCFKILNHWLRKWDKQFQMFTVTPTRVQNFFPKKYMMMGIKNSSICVHFKNISMPQLQNAHKKEIPEKPGFKNICFSQKPFTLE
jgi:hypothetical protein